MYEAWPLILFSSTRTTLTVTVGLSLTEGLNIIWETMTTNFSDKIYISS